MEARRRLLLDRRFGQEITSQLFDRELVERQVVIERVDHPVPEEPGVGSRTINLVA